MEREKQTTDNRKQVGTKGGGKGGKVKMSKVYFGSLVTKKARDFFLQIVSSKKNNQYPLIRPRGRISPGWNRLLMNILDRHDL